MQYAVCSMQYAAIFYLFVIQYITNKYYMDGPKCEMRKLFKRDCGQYVLSVHRRHNQYCEWKV